MHAVELSSAFGCMRLTASVCMQVGQMSDVREKVRAAVQELAAWDLENGRALTAGAWDRHADRKRT